MRSHVVLRATMSLVVLMAVAGCTSATVVNQGQIKIGTEYVNPGRTFFERIVTLPETGEIFWQGGNVYPKQPTSSQKEDLSLVEIISEPVHSCSDAMYRCIYAVFRVFAVPRAGLTSTSEYSIGGAEFRVEYCLRGDDNRCQVALISSDCQQHSGTDACEQVAGGRQRSAAPGPVLYFIYNDDFGVTSYGSVKEPLQTESAKIAASSKWILMTDKGLLVD